MNEGRRDFVLALGGAGLLLAADLLTLRACEQQRAWNQAAFETRSLLDAVKAMGGGEPLESEHITITSPDVAENGAVVPFEITSGIPDTRGIALLIEENPAILAATFSIPHGTDPWVHTGVKMHRTSRVIALVKRGDGKFYYASREVKVRSADSGG